MAEKQLFPVFDLPQIPETDAVDEIYRQSVYFDYELGDFRRDGSGRLVVADGREAWIQWCIKMVGTERLTCLAYNEDIGTEFEAMGDLSDVDSNWMKIQKTITDALMMHRATEWVSGFEFENDGEDVVCSFEIKGYPWAESHALTVRV